MKLPRHKTSNNQGRGAIRLRCASARLGGEGRTSAHARARAAAFTLAEVLAALVFLAILIPVIAECLSIASRAGEVATGKTEAVRVADRILNESIVTTNWNQSAQSGTVNEGAREFNWTLNNEPWNQDPIRLLTVQVKYTVQGKDYTVQLSTLADGSFSQSMTNN
jgi:type II secretory pathway pseudopilin PulG